MASINTILAILFGFTGSLGIILYLIHTCTEAKLGESGVEQKPAFFEASKPESVYKQIEYAVMDTADRLLDFTENGFTDFNFFRPSHSRSYHPSQTARSKLTRHVSRNSSVFRSMFQHVNLTVHQLCTTRKIESVLLDTINKLEYFKPDVLEYTKNIEAGDMVQINLKLLDEALFRRLSQKSFRLIMPQNNARTNSLLAEEMLSKSMNDEYFDIANLQISSPKEMEPYYSLLGVYSPNDEQSLSGIVTSIDYETRTVPFINLLANNGKMYTVHCGVIEKQEI